MKKITFGKLLRDLRVKRGFGLRAFAKKVNMQPSNLSFIENGRVPPPQDESILFRMANLLDLKKGSPEWGQLFDLAVEGRKNRLPADIAADREMRDLLPVMLRTVANQKLKASDLKELIQQIKSYRPE